jgi:hypothetical protein
LEYSREFILKNSKDKELNKEETSFKKIKNKFGAIKY